MKNTSQSTKGKQWKISCKHTSENNVCKIRSLNADIINTAFPKSIRKPIQNLSKQVPS